MTPHKYRVGQQVTFTGYFRAAASPNPYEVTKLLPPNGTELQYRLKSLAERHERVAREDQLDPVAAALALKDIV